ncbi:MAG TPA: thioredoxin domain-containing protein [Rhizomicrobium sp.]|nr:thioredoxin domain-containing protein [Rhizomicrobium sp.]
MQNIVSTLVTAICGAMIAVAAVIVMTNTGIMPVNEIRIRNYLLTHPQLVAEMTQSAQRLEEAQAAQARQAAVRKVGLKAFFDPRIAFVTGPEKAANTIVEFYDYECPFCRASLPAVQKIYERRKHDTRFAFIEMPLQELHGESAMMAARASTTVARTQPDKFLAFHYALMSRTEDITDAMVMEDARKAGVDIARLRTDMAKPEIAQAVNASYDFAKKAGLDGTPTFVINGIMYPGAMDEAGFAAALKKKAS